jgi:pilus assembly protein CpaE
MLERSEQPQSLIRCLLVDRNQETLSQSRFALTASGLADVCAETTSYALAVSHTERNNPDFVFCGVDENPQDILSFIEKIREKFPMIRIVCVGDSGDSTLILHCFRAGADEYLPNPLQREALLEMFPRLRARRSAAPLAPAAIERRGTILAIWGSRGGCGTTTLASNLASLLAQSKSAMLIDLHETQGDLGLFFDQQPTYSINDIWGRGDRIDDSLVDSITIGVENGLRLLLQPYEDLPGAWNAEEFGRLLNVLQSKYEYTMLDIGHGVNAAHRVLAKVDELYLVLNQTLPSLFLATRKVRWLEETGFDLKNLRVVINAYNSGSSVTHNHISKTLRAAAPVLVRYDERNVHSAMNQGITLRNVTRWGKAFKDIRKLADQILNQPKNPGTQKENANELTLRPMFSSKTAMEAMQ